jgi:hypothetical protein
MRAGRLDRFLTLVSVAPLALTFAWFDTFEWSDNGLFLMAGESVRRGEVPYRDFFWHYLPGGPYLTAGLQVLFGPHYVPVRAFFILAVALTVILTLRCCRILSGRVQGWVACAVLLPTISWRPVLNHAVLEPLAAVSTVLLVMRARVAVRPWKLLVAGTPAALLLLFNHLAGGMLLIGVVAAVAFAERLERGPLAIVGRRLFSQVLLIAIPSALVLLGVVLLGVIRGGNRELFDFAVGRLFKRYLVTNAQTNIFDLTPIRRSAAAATLLSTGWSGAVRSIRTYGLAMAMRMLPSLGAIATMFFLGRRRDSDDARRGLLTPLAIAFSIGAAMYLECFKGWKQEGNNVASLCLFVCAWNLVLRADLAQPWVCRGLAGVGLVVGMLALSFLPGQAIATVRDWRTLAVSDTPLGRIRSANVDDARFRIRLLAAIKRHSGTRSLFSYYYDPALYPATGLRPVSAYRYFTITFGSKRDFDRVCAELGRDPPDIIVRDPDWDLRPDASTDNELERCVFEHYAVVEQTESSVAGHPYLILLPRSKRAP